ncbi:hypothetical protein HMPREF9554_01281 [Treponema phagedenis F0421]|nr:hypothetical protein HMPREF9554_01281 [Treponema phagedenis F0421]
MQNVLGSGYPAKRLFCKRLPCKPGHPLKAEFTARLFLLFAVPSQSVQLSLIYNCTPFTM